MAGESEVKTKYAYHSKYNPLQSSYNKPVNQNKQIIDQTRRESISRCFKPKTMSAAKDSSKEVYYNRKNTFQMQKVANIVTSSSSTNTIKRGLCSLASDNRVKSSTTITSSTSLGGSGHMFKSINQLKRTNFTGTRNVLDSIERPSKFCIAK